MSDASTNNVGNDRALVFISAFLIVIAGFLLYYPSLALPLHGEDQARFLNDASLHRLVTFPDALQHWPHAPLTVFGYAKNWAFLPLAESGLFLFNILLHVLSGVFLYLVTRKLLGKDFPEALAMLPGLALVLHPLATESVNYLFARPTLQATCVALAASAVYLYAIERPKIQPLLLVLALTLYACAFASSFVVLGLPLIWLGFSRINADSRNTSVVRAFNISAIALMLALFVAWRATGAAAEIGTPHGLSGILAAQSQIAEGLKHFFGTHEMLPDATATLSVLGVLVLGVLLLLGAAAFLGFNLGAPAWWAFVALTSIPCLVDQGIARSEGLLYFPLAGLLVFYAVIVQKIRMQNARYAAAAVLVLFMGYNAYQSYTRTLEWSDPIAFWGDVALSHPGNIQPRLYQGRYLAGLLAQAQDEETAKHILGQAKTVWEAAERTDPMNVEAQAGLGETLYRLNENDAAIIKLESALNADPFYPGISMLLALAYEKKVQSPADTGNLRQAIAHFKRADMETPLPPQARGRYGMALLTVGDVEGAYLQLSSAQKADPNLPFSGTLQNIEKRMGEARQYMAQAMKAFQEKPDQPDGINLRARADLLSGNPKRAFYLLDRAIVKHSGNRDMWMLNGVTRANLNDTTGFIRDADAKFSGDQSFWSQLAVECANISVWPGALAYLEHAQQWAEAGTAQPRTQLSAIALGLGQVPVAVRLAEEAAQAHPADPQPWLILAQIAVAAKDTDAARTYLGEAEKRGADEDTLKKIQEQGSVDMSAPQSAPVRTIIR